VIVRHKVQRELLLVVQEPCSGDEVYVPVNRVTHPDPLPKQDWEPMKEESFNA